MRKTLLLSQALWAKYTLRLAPEAPGERHGIVSSSSFIPEASARPLRLVAIGDSLVAGSGVEHQDLALTPRIAQKLPIRSIGRFSGRHTRNWGRRCVVCVTAFFPK